jgi:hypothetical protein
MHMLTQIFYRMNLVSSSAGHHSIQMKASQSQHPIAIHFPTLSGFLVFINLLLKTYLSFSFYQKEIF